MLDSLLESSAIDYDHFENVDPRGFYVTLSVEAAIFVTVPSNTMAPLWPAAGAVSVIMIAAR